MGSAGYLLVAVKVASSVFVNQLNAKYLKSSKTQFQFQFELSLAQLSPSFFFLPFSFLWFNIFQHLVRARITRAFLCAIFLFGPHILQGSIKSFLYIDKIKKRIRHNRCFFWEALKKITYCFMKFGYTLEINTIPSACQILVLIPGSHNFSP